MTVALPQRIWDKIEMIPEGGCWAWIGGLVGTGYGSVWHNNKSRPAHIVIYEALIGKVPCWLELDHLCRNRCCCNPYHLEPVTHDVNVKRGTAGHRVKERWEASKTCLQGHPWTPDNTHYRPNGRRHCKACRRLAQQRRRNDSK